MFTGENGAELACVSI